MFWNLNNKTCCTIITLPNLGTINQYLLYFILCIIYIWYVLMLDFLLNHLPCNIYNEILLYGECLPDN